MDLWCVHARSSGFLLRNALPDKRCSSKNGSMALGIRVPKMESLSSYSRYRSVIIKAMAKKNPGNSSNSNSNSNSNSSSSNSGNNDHLKGNNDHLKGEGDRQKGNNPLSGNNKSGDTSPQKSHHKPLDWRELRALLYFREQAETAEFFHDQDIVFPGSNSLPLKWAHPISAPEKGCLLIATEKLDGVRAFERTVILLLRSETRNPPEGPLGIIINRPLNKKMKHMNPTNSDLATTFSDCPLHFGGPLDASMFLLSAAETSGLPGVEEVIPGVYFGLRENLDEASALAKKGKLNPEDLRFFIGRAEWVLDQLPDEIDSDLWYVAACSPNLISGMSPNSSNDLWGEILQLMGGHYSELSRKPKQDF